MPLYTRIANTFSEYLLLRKIQKAAPVKSVPKRSPPRSLSPSADGDTITAQLRNTKKRKASERSTRVINKKAKLNPENESADFEGSTLLISTPNVSRSKKSPVSPRDKADRQLMPPPSTKKVDHLPREAVSPMVKYPTLPDLEDKEDAAALEGTPSRSTRALSSPIDFESMSPDLKARYQAAMTLPENSGIWAEAERDLFFRLALRGFEPLLPQNWMIDFPTYPLTLFSSANSPSPLLHSMGGNDFRATQALKSLSEIGKRIRDRALASPGSGSSSNLRPERIMSTIMSSYIDWTLTDAKVHPNQRPGALPVHIVATLQKNQTTHDAITLMTAQLHDLAALHRLAHGIRESVERDTTPASDETQVLEDDDGLPILTGLLICSSLVVVVTLNAHAVPPTPLSWHETPPATKEESGLRFIATFDFSEAGMDVWNALAVAIVAMHVRKMMLLQYEMAVAAGEVDEGGRWEFVNPKVVDDDGLEDPDA